MAMARSQREELVIPVSGGPISWHDPSRAREGLHNFGPWSRALCRFYTRSYDVKCAESSSPRKFRRNLDSVIEHVPFGPRIFFRCCCRCYYRSWRMQLDEGITFFSAIHIAEPQQNHRQLDRTGFVDVKLRSFDWLTFLGEIDEGSNSYLFN